MSELVEQAKDLNERLLVRSLLTQVPTNPQGTEHADALSFVGDWPYLQPLETVVFERKAYRDVISEGRGVVEWTNPKAKAEIQELAAEVGVEVPV